MYRKWSPSIRSPEASARLSDLIISCKTRHAPTFRPLLVAHERQCLRFLPPLPLNTTPTSCSSVSLEIPSAIPRLFNVSQYLEILQICLPRNNGTRIDWTAMSTRPRDASIDNTWKRDRIWGHACPECHLADWYDWKCVCYWYLDAEFRLSSKLVDEYATLQDVAHEHIDLDDMTSSGLSSITRELALVVQRRKHMLTFKRSGWSF